MQYEQYEQEVKNLQRLIEEAHRIIQDRPVSTSNIQELQAQIQHHEVRGRAHAHTLTALMLPLGEKTGSLVLVLGVVCSKFNVVSCRILCCFLDYSCLIVGTHCEVKPE